MSKVRNLSFLLSLHLMGASAFGADTKVSGFVDAQIQSNSKAVYSKGFMINDGAIYVNRSVKNVDFALDLPFRLVNAGSPNFEIATVKAQAYVGLKYDNGFRWKLGQFDTTYGFEVNDTANVVFSRQGHVYNFTDPFVHTGLQAGFDSGSISVNAIIGAPSDTGTLAKGTNPQFGAQLVMNGDYRFSFGGLAAKSASNNKMSYYVDFTAGANLGSITLDAEVNYAKRQGEVDPNGKELAAGLGSLIHAVYKVDEKLSAGVRGEYITNFAKADPRVAGLPYLKKQMLFFVGPQYLVAEGFKLKFDYSLQNDTDFGDVKTTSHGIHLAGVYQF